MPGNTFLPLPAGPVLGDAAGHAPLRIVGAGMAGLMAAYWCRESGRPFTLYERSQRVGGLLGTSLTPYGPAESAANGFLWTPALQAVADRLNLPLLAPRQEAKARWLLRDARLRRFPLSPGETLTLLGHLMAYRQGSYTTVAEFAQTCLGEAAHRRIVAPGLSGIYGAPTEALSFNAILPGLAAELSQGAWMPAALWRMVRKRQTAASKQANPARGTHAFAGGMQALLDALAKHLAPDIRYGVDAGELNPPSAEAPVLACLPAHAAAAWLERLPAGKPLAGELRAVHYLPMLSVTVFYGPGALPAYKPGFGCLIPAEEDFRILGVLHNHDIFEQRLAGGAAYSLTAIMRDEDARGQAGPWRDRSDAEVATAVAEDIARLYGGGTQPSPLHAVVHRWPQGIPLYSPALSAAWPRMDQRLREAHPGLALFGNYTGQIALRGMAEAARTAFGPAS